MLFNKRIWMIVILGLLILLVGCSDGVVDKTSSDIELRERFSECDDNNFCCYEIWDGDELLERNCRQL